MDGSQSLIKTSKIVRKNRKREFFDYIWNFKEKSKN